MSGLQNSPKSGDLKTLESKQGIMKSKVSFQVTPYPPEGSNDTTSIEMTESEQRPPTPAFSSCPICRNQVEPEGVLPEDAKIQMPDSLHEKKDRRWTPRHSFLLALYSVLTVVMGAGIVMAFVFLGPMGIIYSVPVFIVVMIVVYCLTQSKREVKRQRNTIILRNCKNCRQRLHLKASVRNKIVE